MPKRAEFRRLVAQLQAECATHGIDPSQTAAEDLLADRVQNMAAALHVAEDTVVRSYLSSIEPAELVAAFQLAREHSAQELVGTSPTILDLGSVGRPVVSLGQAVRCVSVNHRALAGSQLDKWQAIGVLDAASKGLTLIGAAMQDADIGPGQVWVLLSDETVVHARCGLAQTVQNLTTGTWTFGHDATLDAEVAQRMASDLTLLPPVDPPEP